MIKKLKDVKYPQYYDVNDIPVVLELDGKDVIGKSANGMPYAIGKAIIEGINISKAEYEKMAKDLYGKNFVSESYSFILNSNVFCQSQIRPAS